MKLRPPGGLSAIFWNLLDSTDFGRFMAEIPIFSLQLKRKTEKCSITRERCVVGKNGITQTPHKSTKPYPINIFSLPVSLLGSLPFPVLCYQTGNGLNQGLEHAKTDDSFLLKLGFQNILQMRCTGSIFQKNLRFAKQTLRSRCSLAKQRLPGS